MLYITCPYCGRRPHEEFTYLGDASKKRPDGADKSDPAWFDFVYLRANPRGPHEELWHHTNGCREVVKVKRDVLTHEIIGCARPNEEIAQPTGESES